jgi:hypothetical protein
VPIVIIVRTVVKTQKVNCVSMSVIVWVCRDGAPTDDASCLKIVQKVLRERCPRPVVVVLERFRRRRVTTSVMRIRPLARSNEFRDTCWLITSAQYWRGLGC